MQTSNPTTSCLTEKPKGDFTDQGKAFAFRKLSSPRVMPVIIHHELSFLHILLEDENMCSGTVQIEHPVMLGMISVCTVQCSSH